MINRIRTYDLETNSAETSIENPVLQAAVKTYDRDLNEVDDGQTLFVQLGAKYANPFATAVHGLSPITLQKEGMSNHEFAHTFKEMFSDKDDEAVMSFNGHFFDDKVMRHTLFNNGIDPYAMEKGGKGTSFDVFKLTQLAVVRESDAIDIPQKDDGRPSLKLEQLSDANGIVHENAHDAQSDIDATSQLAKLIKDRDPELWKEFEATSNKFEMRELVEELDPVVRVTNSKWGIHTTPIIPLAINPDNQNEAFGVKLDKPKELTKVIDKFSPEELEGMMLMDKSDRPKGLKSDSGHPFVKLKMNRGAPLLDASEVIENQESTFNLKLDKIEEGMEILEARGGDVVKAVLSAYKGDPNLQYDNEGKTHSDRVYSVKFSSSDRMIMNAMSAPNEDGVPRAAEKDFNAFDTAKQFSSDNVTHLHVLTAMKFDHAISKIDTLTPDNIKDTIESLAFEDNGNSDSKYEALVYIDILKQRLDSFTDAGGNGISMMDKFRDDINEVSEKRPEDFARNRGAIMDAKEHNQVLADGLELVKELGSKLEAQVGISLEDKLHDYQIEIQQDRNKHIDQYMENKANLSVQNSL